jgi:hypothetical protein
VGKYRSLGTLFNRVFRNDLNANFDAVDADINVAKSEALANVNAQKTRVDNLIIGTPQPSEIVDARGGFSVLRDRLDSIDSQKVKKGDLFINVVDFGAKSIHEVADFDSTSAIQAAIDSVAAYSFSRGATIYFPMGIYKFSEVLISTKHITLTGVGVLKGTVKVRGVSSADPVTNNIPDMFTTIKGLRFIHDVGNNTDAVVFQNMRAATVEGCYFENYRNAIYGESLRNDVPYQQTSRVIVDGCKFRSVDYAVKTTWKIYDSITGGVVSPSTWRYNQHGDWQVVNCHAYFYTRGITHLHFEGQDGLVCSNNILFHGLYSDQSPNKQYNIYLKQSNFAVISNNDLFEAGYESIYCEDYRSLNITGNNIAWCGQRDAKSGIYLEVADQSTYSEASAVVANNNIAYPTRHGVWVGYFATNVKVSGNVVTKIGDGRFYYGTTTLGSVSHYGIFVGDPSPTFTEQNNVVVSDNFYDGTLYQNRGVSINNHPFSFVQANRTFGNINTTSRTVTNTLDLSAIITKNSNPYNQAYPYILKNVSGTIDTITGANIGQIVTIICANAGSLTITASGTATDKISMAANVTLSGDKSITLQKTDTYWVRIG